MTLTKEKPKRVPTNYRKVHGAHHKQDEHYIKHYWPYLPVLAVLGIGLLFNHLITRSTHDVLGYSTSVTAKSLLAETNNARSLNHETSLEINPQLAAAAQAKANDMATRGYWSHVTPDGKQPWSFMTTAGYHYQEAGENLAYGFGSSDQVVAAWMNSAEHRANILNNDYRDVGFATANVANYQGHGPETIIVAMYGQPMNLNATSVLADQAPTTADLSQVSAPVSRLQVVTNASWVQLAVAALCGAALMLFFVRHALAWHKVLVRGERFMLRHPLFDTFLISLAVFMFLLSHLAGTIL
ncbi:MAG TPA: CAP domain-containing protein [Candidatus Saccharimonadales bacterium]|nr:CAP domain-containing protein [Candidatus Saccharimonadales bacterium]